jgi:hypothetical protein
MIYLISGKKSSGKDTICSYINKKTLFPVLSFARPIKEITKHILKIPNYFFDQECKEKKLIKIHKYSKRSSLDEHQFDPEIYTSISVRSIMQDIGQYFRDVYSKDFWIETLINSVKKENLNSFIISDVRYNNEITKIKESFNDVISIRVERPSVQPNQYSKHLSEVELDNYPFDYVINNNGTLEDLYIKLNSILLANIVKEER